MLRPRLPRIGNSLKSFRRSLHRVPELSHDFRYGIARKDTPDYQFLSAPAFDIAWTRYQSLMVEKLNKLVVGGEWENQTPKNIAIKYARDPNWAPVFNYASMAHNNHFFFKNLHPNPPPMPEVLEKELVDSFGSIETLKREFVITASSMFGPGFVWLVKEQPKKYSILCTYLAGSPYPGAHYRKQPVDMNTEDTTLPEHVRRMVREAPVNTVGAHGPRSQRAKPLAPGGIDLLPVLCLNMWEHVYLPDYGVGAFGEGGKMGYAERWWDFIDWDAVAKGAQAGQSVQYES